MEGGIKALVIIALSLVCSYGYSQKLTDRQADSIDITMTIQNYFDGMMEPNRSKLDIAFHEDARLVGYRRYRFSNTGYKEWSAVVSRGDKRDTTEYSNNLVNIDIQGYTAVASCELFWPDIYYYDFLTLLRVDGRWKIVNKTWYEKLRDE